MTAKVQSRVESPAARLAPGRALTLTGIADGAEGLVIADLARTIASGARPPAISMAVICRDGARMAMLARALGFFAPDIEVLEFPAWDCLPYDRVSPHAGIVAQRMTTLARLARVKGRDTPVGPADDGECRSAARAGARDRWRAIARGCARQSAADVRHHPMARTQRL